MSPLQIGRPRPPTSSSIATFGLSGSYIVELNQPGAVNIFRTTKQFKVSNGNVIWESPITNSNYRFTNGGSVGPSDIDPGTQATLTLRFLGQYGLSGGNLSVGGGFGKTGTLNVGQGGIWNGNASATTSIDVGAVGTGIVNVLGGGKVSTNYRTTLANNFGSHGIINVSGPGSQWTSGDRIDIGTRGNGEVSVSNGGKVTGLNAWVGDDQGTGVLTVSGANTQFLLNAPLDALQVGHLAQGTVNVNSGGYLHSHAMTVGFDSNGIGTVSVTGAIPKSLSTII